MPAFRIVDRRAASDDLAYWLAKTPAERVEAVEFLRRQCFLAAGTTEEPRLEKVLKLVPRSA